MPASIVAIGEVLWDILPQGAQFGGAPANFACASAELGQGHVLVSMVSAVGRDSLGSEAIRTLEGFSVQTKYVTPTQYPTGRVDVEIDVNGKPKYTFVENPAWDHLEWNEHVHEEVASANIVCFGTLGQRSPQSRDTIRRLLASGAANDRLQIFDINLRTPFWNEEVIQESLHLANVLKLNDEELPILAKMFHLEGSEESILRSLLERYRLRCAALTRGSNGSLLISATGDRSEVSGIPVEMVDTVGAGDSFTAALGLGLSFGLPLGTINRWATKVAAYVCTQSGGTPKLPHHLHFSEVLFPK